MHRPVIVAHRGLSSLFPENTLLAIDQAIIAGARAVEFDVQMSVDNVPIVFHDAKLDRLTGKKGIIMNTSLQQLNQLSAYFPARFANEYLDVPITTLETAIALFEKNPQVKPCIEIKIESLDYFGVNTFVDSIINTSKSVIEQTLFLSFSYKAIEYLHSIGIKKTCWVLEHYNNESLKMAEKLVPQVLAVSIKKLPDSEQLFWPGSWKWMVYQTEDPVQVKSFASRGADFIETDNIKLIAEALPEYFV